MKNFKDRVAVITGGASGIGLGMARRFGAAGMKLVIADVDEPAMASATAELEAAGHEVLTHRTDVSRGEALEALAEATLARFGAAHVLCNNAGVGGYQRFENTTEATWDWTLGVDLMGPIHGCRVFLPILEKQDEAHIVTTASVAAVYASAYQHPYNVAKAGVVALTEGLYREFKTEKPHVGVSVLLPAQVNTAIVNDERNAPPGHRPRSAVDPDLEAFRTMVFKGLASGKSPDEVGDIVLAGIRERRLHIFTHPEWTAVVKQRSDDIVAGQPLRDISPKTFNPDGGHDH